jgi:hypothetical protein
MTQLLSMAGEPGGRGSPDQVERQASCLHPRTAALYRELTREALPATGS